MAERKTMAEDVAENIMARFAEDAARRLEVALIVGGPTVTTGAATLIAAQACSAMASVIAQAVEPAHRVEVLKLFFAALAKSMDESVVPIVNAVNAETARKRAR